MSDDELKMIWEFRRSLFRLYAVTLILSIPTAVIIAIVTRNVIPSITPAPLLFAMKPMVKWAFPRQTS